MLNCCQYLNAEPDHVKYNLIKRDPIINGLDIELNWDEEVIDLQPEFLPADTFKIDTEIGQISIWEKYEGSGAISFVNSAMCSGIHQRIINERRKAYYNYQYNRTGHPTFTGFLMNLYQNNR